jgi:phosphoserine phosphatase
VDLDGTLLATDSLHELALALAVRRPADLLRVPAWLARGRAALKARLAERAALDPALLPYRAEVLDALRAARAAGRAAVLVTAADRRVAEAVAAHLGLFTEVLASDGATNLKGRRKAERLRERFGAGGFEYLGDAAADLPVWEAAGSASLVAPRAGLRRRVASRLPVERILGARAPRGARARAWLRALGGARLAEDLLVALPFLLAGRLLDPALAARAAAGVAAFALASAALALAGGLAGAAADRADPLRRGRPFASGELEVAAGAALAPLLLLASAALAAARLPAGFAAALAAYVLAGVLHVLAGRRAPPGPLLRAVLWVLRLLAGVVALAAPA